MKMKRQVRHVLMLLVSSLLPAITYAHPEGDVEANFVSGILHPLGGLDHILAMVAVGIWAAQMGGRARWLFPAAFVALMVVGGVVGIVAPGFLFIEQGIVTSIFIFGALISWGRPLPFWSGVPIAGGAALFHGYAHGAEMPAVGSAWEYALGFVSATTLLHGAGLAGTGFVQRSLPSVVVKFLGVAILLGGVYVVSSKLGLV